jgi:mRNA interferase RelE/StbE
MYKIIFTQRAIRDLDNITQDTKQRLANKIKEYSREPLKYARKLIDQKIGTYRFRVGDYRIVFDIVNDNIVVLRIGHRKEIYK